MSKLFPIKTATACQLKWNWSTLYLHGAVTNSCHRTGQSNLTVENFSDFHNTEKKILERQRMLQGLWPEHSCQYCQEIEASGGFSDRQLHLSVPNMSPPELEKDPTAVKINPTILEVYFNNTCNLACLYCTPDLSSKINQENIKFGDFVNHGIELKASPIYERYPALLQQFWDWMHNHSHTLKRFNVLGGEPFYQQEFDTLLDYFKNNPHRNLQLCIVTNLMISPARLQSLIDQFKLLLKNRHLARIDITCSIDCWGAEQEYVRYGLDLDRWLQNFETLLAQPWLTININQTISVLTIKTMPSLIEKLLSWKQIHPVGHYFSVVSPQPNYMRPQILGPAYFEKDFDRILTMMPEITLQDRMAKSYMRGIKDATINCDRQPDLIKDLAIFLDEKDRRRNTDWKKIFPWLVKEIDHVV